jgi:hypothetical protein
MGNIRPNRNWDMAGRRISPTHKRRQGPGRPAFEPTPEQRTLVESLVAYGIQYLEICRLVINPQTDRAIDTKTLMLHFRDELDVGATKANAKVAESLYKQALAGNTTAGIWWTKCRMGWKETIRSEHTGADGGPIVTEARDRLAHLIAGEASALETGESAVGANGRGNGCPAP